MITTVMCLGNDETVSMIKKEGGKAYAYTVDMSNRSFLL